MEGSLSTQDVPTIQAQLDSPTRLIVLGNPGAGKSTLLNGLVGKGVFNAGLSFQGSLTLVSQAIRASNGNVFIDTPGLSDYDTREKAAEEITTALRENATHGNLKLIFVVTFNDGRVRTTDTATIKLVLDALPADTPYGIIVNKIGTRALEKVNTVPKHLEELTVRLNLGRDNKTTYLHFIKHDEELVDAENAIPGNNNGLIEFINSLPNCVINDEDEIKAVRSTETEAEVERLTKFLGKIENDKKRVEKEFDDLKKKHGGHSTDDIFSMFFGGTGGRRRGGGRRKGKDVNHVIKVSLEDLYNGKTVKLAINRQVLVGEAQMCDVCGGQGEVLELCQIALGMISQVQKRCTNCNGMGYIGETKKERKVLDVHIEKGMKNGHKVVVRGMTDEQPNMRPGDINFIVQEKEHELFKRMGADLLITKTLSLNEALCGFEWTVTHLDKREIVIQSRPGEVIKPESIGGQPLMKKISGEGMPSNGNPFVKGDLYVLFTVEFPKDGELSEDILDVLRKTLPNPKMDLYDEEHVEICHLDGADIKNFGKGRAATHNYSYDSDDEGGQQNAECRQS